MLLLSRLLSFPGTAEPEVFSFLCKTLPESQTPFLPLKKQPHRPRGGTSYLTISSPLSHPVFPTSCVLTSPGQLFPNLRALHNYTGNTTSRQLCNSQLLLIGEGSLLEVFRNTHFTSQNKTVPILQLWSQVLPYYDRASQGKALFALSILEHLPQSNIVNGQMISRRV